MEHYPDIQRRDGTLFFTCPASDRAAIATSIERLIDLLDATDSDPDLEPYLAGFDHQTSDREDDAGDDREADTSDDELDHNGDEQDCCRSEDEWHPLAAPVQFSGTASAMARDMIRGLPIAAKRADAYALAGVPLVYQFGGGRHAR